MKLDDGIITESQMHEITTASTLRLFNSTLESLHGVGVAPKGELTTMIGPKGNGKSAFIKTILYQACIQNVKVLTILSEEKTYIYKKPINEVVVNSFPEEKAKENLTNVLFTSMLDWPEESKNTGSFLAKLENIVDEQEVDMVILDNFTTSFFGRLHINEQSKAAEKLREFASVKNISMLVVAHTIKGINQYQSMITGEDVRGNATLVNISAYVYVLTTFFRCNPPRAFLYIDKARYFSDFNQTYWELKFEKSLGVYTEDKKVSASFIEALMGQIRKESRDMNAGAQIWKEQRSIKKKDHWTQES